MNKKGVSIIILVITVITLNVLLGLAVFRINVDNPIDDARIAVFKNNFKECNEEFERVMTKSENASSVFKRERIGSTIPTVQNPIPKPVTGYANLKKYIPSISREFSEKVKIVNGVLVLNEENLTKKERDEDVIKDPIFNIEITNKNRNPEIDMQEHFYIPIGFKPNLSNNKIIDEDSQTTFYWNSIKTNDINEFNKIFDEKFPISSFRGAEYQYDELKKSAFKYKGFFGPAGDDKIYVNPNLDNPKNPGKLFQGNDWELSHSGAWGGGVYNPYEITDVYEGQRLISQIYDQSDIKCMMKSSGSIAQMVVYIK